MSGGAPPGGDPDAILRGATLRFRRWRAPRPGWDHDHCHFCWAKFMEEGAWPDAPEPPLHEGWTTEDGYHWVCAACFGEHREREGWVAGGP